MFLKISQDELLHPKKDYPSFTFPPIPLSNFFKKVTNNSVKLFDLSDVLQVPSETITSFSITFFNICNRFSVVHLLCSQFGLSRGSNIYLSFSRGVKFAPKNYAFLKILFSSKIISGLGFLKIYRNFQSTNFSHSDISEWKAVTITGCLYSKPLLKCLYLVRIHCLLVV